MWPSNEMSEIKIVLSVLTSTVKESNLERPDAHFPPATAVSDQGRSFLTRVEEDRGCDN